MTTGKAKSSQLFLKQLAEFLKHCESIAAEDTDGALRTLGYDPEQVAARGQALADKLFGEQIEAERAEIKKSRIAAQHEVASAPAFDFKSEADVDKAISEIVAGRFGQTAQSAVLAFNHNYQRPTVNDKLSLLKDLGFLKAQAAKAAAHKK